MATCVLQIDDLPPVRGIRRVRVTAYIGPSGHDLGTQGMRQRPLRDVSGGPSATDLVHVALGAVGAELDLRGFEERLRRDGHADEVYHVLPVGLYQREERADRIELLVLDDGAEVEIEQGVGGYQS